jgi:hypothetical protein
MKDQYFGDINDYRKYGLLRTLSDNGKFRVGVCWMLTEPDSRSDGQFIKYLSDSMHYRFFDPSLYDALLPCLADPFKRNVAVAETSNIIPNGLYYPATLTDNAKERARYFSEFSLLSRDCDLVFFDPDNGLEVGSVGKGRKGSSKYVYWDDFQQSYESGKSLLVYQHFCRVKRDLFIRDLTDQVREKLGVSEVILFRTPHVLFLLMPQQAHMETIKFQSNVVADTWGSQIQVGL